MASVIIDGITASWKLLHNNSGSSKFKFQIEPRELPMYVDFTSNASPPTTLATGNTVDPDVPYNIECEANERAWVRLKAPFTGASGRLNKLV